MKNKFKKNHFRPKERKEAKKCSRGLRRAKVALHKTTDKPQSDQVCNLTKNIKY